MIFGSDDAGPWYLSCEQREAQRNDRATGQSRRVERSKKLLTIALAAAGVELPQQRNFTRRELQAFAKTHNVDVFEEKQQIISGWQGQPKGLLQVLWERGLIDEASLEKYTLNLNNHSDFEVESLIKSIDNAIAENAENKQLVKEECQLFDLSRNQSYRSYLHPDLVNWLDS